ncbi:hypothetical protein NliqN6_5290 [Naganishia liquefaciens]|uniref:Mitochondrial distribution and morphology protein 34 n=1 Tax=Naganishia liquefaciens TaxID=104408 RepID=A0A8H3TXH1_9TREE|nr:hypothetical protein NliqN6_5290 [Naganishia liquefaciens]
MSFCFPSWSTAFSPAFHEDAKAMLEGALNKGSKPPVIQGKIEVVELSMGKIPPTLTLLEIGDLSLDRFRGIFKLGYQGDAWLEVRCRVQANPLSHNPHLHANHALPMSTPLLASQPLLVPMTLKLSLLNLRAILILVVSKSKGITLVFKNDPLQNVDVSSTFDSIEVIRGYLQQEIEGQLREMFREDLPGIIHRLSQKWFAGSGMGGRVEMPYRNESVSIRPDDPGTPMPQPDDEDPHDWHDPYREREIFPPYRPSENASDRPTNTSSSDPTSPSSRRKSRSTPSGATPIPYGATSLNGSSMPSRRPRSAESPTSYTTFPDIEDYDPTYGMRPEGVPTHSGYEAFGRLWERAKEEKGRGLGGLMKMEPVREGWTEGDVEEDWEAEAEAEADELDDLLEGLQRIRYRQDHQSDDVDDQDDDVTENASVDAVDASPSLRVLNREGSKPFGLRGNSSAAPSAPSSTVSGWNTPTYSASGKSAVLARPRIFHAQSQIRAPSEAGTVGRTPHVNGLSALVPRSNGLASSPVGTTGAGSTARPSSVRSSTGGSVLGLGVARSLIDQQTGGPGRFWHPPGNRHHADRQDLVMSAKNGPGMRPELSRRHSRAESLPSHTFQRQMTKLPPTRLSNVVAVANGGGEYQNGDYEARPAGPGSPPFNSRPLSMPMAPKEISSNALTVSPSRRGRRLSNAYRPFLMNNSPPNAFGGTRISNGIVLPLNDSVSQLATLSHSNHTLSPYARNHQHIAVRSFPHLLSRANSMYAPNTGGYQSNFQYGPGMALVHGSHHAGWSGAEVKSKAKRKRIFRIGGNAKDNETDKAEVIEASAQLNTEPVNRASIQPISGASTPQLYSRGATVYSDKLPVTPRSRPTSVKPGLETVTQKSHNRPPMASRTSYGFPV